MLFRFAADSVVLLHFGFVLFVVFGGLLVLRWPRFVFAHIPAVVWGVFIEFSGGVCPLSPLENRLRHAAGEVGYTGGFIEQYLIPVIYPDGLDRGTQVALGLAVVGINIALYGLLLAKRAKRKEEGA